MTNVLDIIKSLNVGDLFYESYLGEAEEYIVLTEPVLRANKIWTWTARVSCPNNPRSQEIMNFGVHEEFLQYAPKLSLTPDWS